MDITDQYAAAEAFDASMTSQQRAAFDQYILAVHPETMQVLCSPWLSTHAASSTEKQIVTL